jgi:hypothetical protein
VDRLHAPDDRGVLAQAQIADRRDLRAVDVPARVVVKQVADRSDLQARLERLGGRTRAVARAASPSGQPWIDRRDR